MRGSYFFSMAAFTRAITSSGLDPHLNVPALGSPSRTPLSLLTSAPLAAGGSPSSRPAAARFPFPFAAAGAPPVARPAPNVSASRKTPVVRMNPPLGRIPSRDDRAKLAHKAERKRAQK